MKGWTLAPLRTICGCCGDDIARGAACLELTGPTWRKVRCERCAGEPKPEHVTESRPGMEIRKRTSEVRGLASLARDWKHSQAGDR